MLCGSLPSIGAKPDEALKWLNKVVYFGFAIRDSISEIKSSKSYSFTLSLLVSFGKTDSLDINMDSNSSGLPYRSLRRSQIFHRASAGFETFDDLMLAAYFDEVGPNHFVRRSSSSVFVASSSFIISSNCAFQNMNVCG